MSRIQTLTVCFTLIVLFSVFGIGCDDDVNTDLLLDGHGSTQMPKGIISGSPTGAANWQGVVLVMAGGGMCSGTLIHPQVVLTAGHCVKTYDSTTGRSRDYTSRPGRVSVSSGASAFRSTRLGTGQTIVTHPSWTGELLANSGDLSLIKLTSPVNTNNFPTYKLRDFPAPTDGEKGLLVGYGATGGYEGSGERRSGDTTLLSVDSDVIETGVPANTCQGDSGGPLFTKQNGEWVVTGVTSFGNSEQCFEDYGSYSVNLTAYCTWIDKTLQELVGEGLGLEKCSQCAPKKASSWGAPCGEGYEPCPQNTKCRAPEGFSNGKIGYCAPNCCSIREPDSSFCGDVADGEELCAFADDSGDRYCAIHCESDADCPDGTACKNKPWESEKICIATEKGPGGPGTATDVDTGDGMQDDRNEGNEDSGDVDGVGDADADADADSDADGDSDDPANTDTGSEGCGCSTTGGYAQTSLGQLIAQLF